MRRYVTLGWTKTVDNAIELAPEYEAITKVETFIKRRAIHSISSDLTKEIKEHGVN